MAYRKTLLISLFSLSAISNALALNSSVPFEAPNDDGAPLMKSTDSGAEKYRTVGKFNGYSHCTATLIAGENAPDKNTPALILTAGHCVDSNVGTNDVMIDQAQAVPDYWQYTPDYFIDKKDNLSPVKVNRILYSTMKNEDIAVLELKATYGELAQKGYHPMRLKKNLEMKHQPIVLTHIPVNNVDYNDYLRKSECDIRGKSPELYEGDSPWFWSPVFSVNCAGVVGGSSGSPVFEKGQTNVIGVLNTTTEPGITGCGGNRPCIIENNKGVPQEGISYFIPVDNIANALTKDSKLDLSKLQNGSGNVLEKTNFWSPWISQSVDPTSGEKAKWDVVIKENANVKNIRYKTGLISEVNCADEAGYGAPALASQDPLQNLLLPEKDGIYKLCVINQNNDGQWQKTKDASIMLREIDNTPPSIKPTLHVNDYGDSAWTVTAEPRPYELGSIFVKYGPKATTHCDDKADYSLFWRPVNLDKSKAPWRVCAYGEDTARNASQINVLDFDSTIVE